MSRMRFGLQARFLIVMGLAFALVVAILVLLLQRQTRMQGEVRALSGAIIHDLFDRSLRSRGEALTSELADALVNPMYYSDLDQVGALVRNTSRQQVVSYVRVFDRDGRVLHDGSIDIPDYGQPMHDPLAPQAVAARKLTMQWALTYSTSPCR